MKYERFEDLPVWNAAMVLSVRVYVLTRDRFISQPGDLREQSRRGALPVPKNIAEGFERGSTAELLAFLYIARGSAGEDGLIVHFIERLPDTKNFKFEISDLKSLTESCSRRLRAWANSLQISDLKGQRHLTDRSRASYDQKKNAQAFQQRLVRSL